MSVKSLLEEIESRRIGVQWFFPFDELMDWLPVKREAIIKILYEKGSSSLSTALNGFDRENVTDLIYLLEQAGFKGASSAFFQAGYCFQYVELDRWHDFYVSVVLSKIHSAQIDLELLDDSIHASPDFESAAFFYCRSHFDLESYRHFAMNLFLQNQGVQNHELSKKLLMDHLDDLFARKVISEDMLFKDLFPILARHAKKFGYIQIDKKKSLRSLIAADILNNALFQEALQVLDIGIEDDFNKIKKQYYRKLKSHHPDIDPAGLEKTKELIGAYDLICQSVE